MCSRLMTGPGRPHGFLQITGRVEFPPTDSVDSDRWNCVAALKVSQGVLREVNGRYWCGVIKISTPALFVRLPSS